MEFTRLTSVLYIFKAGVSTRRFRGGTKTGPSEIGLTGGFNCFRL